MEQQQQSMVGRCRAAVFQDFFQEENTIDIRKSSPQCLRLYIFKIMPVGACTVFGRHSTVFDAA